MQLFNEFINFAEKNIFCEKYERNGVVRSKLAPRFCLFMDAVGLCDILNRDLNRVTFDLDLPSTTIEQSWSPIQQSALSVSVVLSWNERAKGLAVACL